MSSDIETRIRNSFPQLAEQMDAIPQAFAPGWLKTAATQNIGEGDFGPDIFEDPLARLCTSVNEDADLNAYGRMLLAGMIRTQLENRLLMQRLRAAGKLGQLPIAPIIVTGLPRTGTTFLHRLLASDPRHASLPYWQLMRPFPRGPNDTPEVRIDEAKTVLDVRRAITPELDGVHLIRAESPEECMFVTAMSLQSRLYWNLAPVYSFMEWYNAADRTDKYREYVEALSYLQSLYPDRRLILKAPDHVDGVSELLDVFSEAIVVQTHRDMTDQFGSYMSLGRVTRSLAVRKLDNARETEAVLNLTDSSIARNLEARSRHPGKILDIRYDDLTTDPLGCVKAIYAHAGLTFTDHQRASLASHLQSNTKGKHGAHDYDLSEFGLTAAAIKERYSDYETKFLT
ncbi:sulfotransferase [Alisedimentitalea sp. MJ-SS2]|uniref:sulfotransferase family protein n=1 Tax=Aliisedimentitalea sp. MJ-SS2 TaxID=3049795 RepID=UPI0029151B89|nr:sulfotransferase [Alisedimentitalea sp. MJ-SS2]MDU8929128.1 sulfotransferase [Alisedimentitalea sp. MJ-SS2]